MNPFVKLALDIGPLLVFFGAYARAGIMAATGAFMAATVIALGITYALSRRIPILPLVTAVVVLVFGGLTLLLDDALFIKLKPTIIYGLFASALFGGLLFDRPLLKPLLGVMVPLTERAWRTLSLRWAWYFVVCAVINEVVRRGFSTDVWVTVKVFGFLPLTVLFALSQVPFIQRHTQADPS